MSYKPIMALSGGPEDAVTLAFAAAPAVQHDIDHSSLLLAP